MGRDVRKLAPTATPKAMEAAQVVGVRTRSRSRTLALAAAAASSSRKGGSKRRRRTRMRAAEVQISCVQLRSGNVAARPGISRSRRCSSPEMGRISRSSSNASCEMLEGEEELRLLEDDEGLKASGAIGETMERREVPQSSRHLEEHGDVESTADREQDCDVESTAERKIKAASTDAMPSQAEIDDFFTTAEAAQKRRFSDKYNYDVDSDAPLDGRFEWVLIKP